MKYLLSLMLIGLCSVSFAAKSVELKWPSANPTKTCVFTPTTPIGSTMIGDFTGGDCPALTGVAPPVITNGIEELPSTALANTNFTVRWAANANNCSYASSVFPNPVPGWPTTGMPPCYSTGMCSLPRDVSLVFPAAGIYQFALTCTNAGSSVVASSTKTVQVTNPTPTGCNAPAGLRRHVYGTVAYNNTVSRDTDLTKFENVFGHNLVTPELRMFPGTANLNQRVYIPRGYYVSLQFTVPATMPVATYGLFRFEETQPQTVPARMSFVISKQCGDFTASVSPKCVADGPVNSAVMWGYDPGKTHMCALIPGETYFLNIVHASLTTPGTSTCQMGTCGNTMQHQKISAGGW